MDRRVRPGDLKLIAALLLAGLAVIALMLCLRQDGRWAVVQVDGRDFARLSLSEDQEFPVEIDGRITNLLRVEGGAIRMAEADCPDHLCIHRGAIRHAGDSIVCLPNRVVVIITGADELDLDAVTG